jgi:hypothetical protein
MEITKRPTKLRINKADDQKFERVREFIYLESAVTEDSNITIEVKDIIVMAIQPVIA